MAPIVAFVLVPLVEIGLFVTLGGWLGLWPTLAWVVLSAVLGLSVLRRQGRSAAEVLAERRALRHGALAEGALATLGAVLLVVPGFLTDGVGLVLLVPAVQRALARRMAARVAVVTAAARTARPGPGGDIIDGDCEPVDPPGAPGRDRIGRH
jgi:UPF0716 protein FxsA